MPEPRSGIANRFMKFIIRGTRRRPTTDILGGFTPSLQDGNFYGARTQDCAALVLGYYQFSLREKGRFDEVLSFPSELVTFLKFGDFLPYKLFAFNVEF